ncbi:DUF2804 domain-containing protein [Treponema sp. TIM-1]|uniref:DUF2804 domain-containing protein n=1 Tax=Treponema sp. TIM-1 TaxID=2898417 RepID=UPI00398106D8
MYTREIQAPQGTPIEKGKPLQGTWVSAFNEVDLLNIHRPFSFPFPKWMRDYRIKEWETFIINSDCFFLEAMLANMKYYRMAQVYVYDKETKKLLQFRKTIPLNGWKLPRDLYNSSIISQSYGFFFRIHNWLYADTIKIDLDIKATRKRPSFTAHLEYDLDRKKITPMAVNLPFSERRCMYAYKVLAALRGDMVFEGRHISLDPAKTLGIFGDIKGFFPYRMYSVWCTGLGFDAENRSFGFSIVENQTKETNKNNENALWVEGRLTPLPPVRITMPEGVDKEWVIQDVEGMVDLTFTPQVPRRTAFNILLTRIDHDTALGYFNGMLINSEEKKIQVRNLWGLGEKLYLRI